ncbi:hypothetical protein NL676_035420 [Syzygium grande]|nr:hypothetical protein NL676_035420 [Syzygium grande]
MTPVTRALPPLPASLTALQKKQETGEDRGGKQKRKQSRSRAARRLSRSAAALAENGMADVAGEKSREEGTPLSRMIKEGGEAQIWRSGGERRERPRNRG